MRKTYRVTGMTCGGCVRSVEAAIKAAVPGAKVAVNLAEAKVTVEPAADAEVKKAVEDAGFAFAGVA